MQEKRKEVSKIKNIKVKINSENFAHCLYDYCIESGCTVYRFYPERQGPDSILPSTIVDCNSMEIQTDRDNLYIINNEIQFEENGFRIGNTYIVDIGFKIEGADGDIVNHLVTVTKIPSDLDLSLIKSSANGISSRENLLRHHQLAKLQHTSKYKIEASDPEDSITTSSTKKHLKLIEIGNINSDYSQTKIETDHCDSFLANFIKDLTNVNLIDLYPGNLAFDIPQLN